MTVTSVTCFQECDRLFFFFTKSQKNCFLSYHIGYLLNMFAQIWYPFNTMQTNCCQTLNAMFHVKCTTHYIGFRGHLNLILSHYWRRMPGCVTQWEARLSQEPEVLGLIPGPVTYFPFSFHWFKKSSCELLARVCARSSGKSR